MFLTAFDPVFIFLHFEPYFSVNENITFFINIQSDADGNKFLDFFGYPLIMDVLCNSYTSFAYHRHKLNSFIHSIEVFFLT